MEAWIAEWKNDTLRRSLEMSWLITVAVSFWGPYLLPITIPVIGTVFAFRIFLVITVALYLYWAISRREFFWDGTTSIEKWSYILIAIMLLYGLTSLPRALDFIHTFRRLFNLCFDLCFFFLMLHLCRKEKMLQATLWVGIVSVAVLCALGIYEVFCGGIFTDVCDVVPRFVLFNSIYQSPMVTGGNVNDYCSILLYISAPFILMILQKNPQSRWKLMTVLLLFPILYFLLLAAASALNLVALSFLWIGIVLYFLISDRKRLWIPLLALLLMGGIRFANQYQYIVPPIQEYLSELQEYQRQPQDSSFGGVPAPKPKLVIGDPHTLPLAEEFYVVNPETEELELREDGTGGVRARLLIHAFRCFRESYGLGIGLGNTEVLARERQITQNGVWSIHCFIARIIADFGIFVLFPLCIIAFLLLKQTFCMLLFELREKNTSVVGYTLCYFCSLCAYPFLSTASSDAQDIIAMWLYLGAMVLCVNRMLHLGKENL